MWCLCVKGFVCYAEIGQGRFNIQKRGGEFLDAETGQRRFSRCNDVACIGQAETFIG